MKIIKSLSILSLSLLFLSACKKDDNDVTKPNDINEGELITTVKFIVTDTDSPFTQYEFQYRDADGIGGNPPSIDTIKLKENKNYSVQLLLLDESKTPFDTISNEVLEESKDHLFVYELGSDSVSITINDFDDNNPPLPLGLISTWSTNSSISTTLKLTLKHQPGIKNGDPVRGETDVEVVMPLSVE